jgi:hypothetical protein
VAFNKLVGAHPVEKVIATVPNGENDVRIAFVHWTQHLVGNKAGHFVDEPGAIAKPLLECIGEFLIDVNTISDGDH